jgi:hypothetical protein
MASVFLPEVVAARAANRGTARANRGLSSRPDGTEITAICARRPLARRMRSGSEDMPRRRALHPLWLTACLCLACNAAGPDPKTDETAVPEPVAAADFDWDGTSVRRHRDRKSGLAFAVPATGFRVTATHFAPTSAGKLEHELRIEQDRREVARIDVWYDRDDLGLSAWFDQHLRFMVTPDAVVEKSRASRGRVETIVVRHPRSPHARARRAAVLWLDGRVVRVTSLDDDDPQVRAIFERVLEQLEIGRQP